MCLPAGAVEVDDGSFLVLGGSTSFRNNHVGIDGGEKRVIDYSVQC